MKSDRFLTAILIGIGALAIIALTLFFVRRGGQDYIADNTPTGVTYNFILAIERADYERAYSYVEQSAAKPTLEQFRISFISSRSNITDVSVQVGSAEITGDTANVSVVLIYNNGNPFNSANRQPQTGQLTRQNGSWKIVQMAYPFWDYNWGQQFPPGKGPVQPAQPVPAPVTPYP